MTFIDELSKTKDYDYGEEKRTVHNTFFIGAIKQTIVDHKCERHFEGYYFVYVDSLGNTHRLFHEDKYKFFSDYHYKNSDGQLLDWNYIEALLIKEIKNSDIGLRDFEIRTIEKNEEYSLGPYAVCKGQKGYFHGHVIWMKAAW